MLAGALIGWGSRGRPRAERFRAVAADLFAIVGGAAVLLVWAGMVEAFVSQYHQPVLPVCPEDRLRRLRDWPRWRASWAGRDANEPPRANRSHHRDARRRRLLVRAGDAGDACARLGNRRGRHRGCVDAGSQGHRTARARSAAIWAAAASVILYFAISIAYGIVLEWRWRGQTLGKRLFGLRVIDAPGTAAAIAADRTAQPAAR